MSFAADPHLSQSVATASRPARRRAPLTLLLVAAVLTVGATALGFALTADEERLILFGLLAIPLHALYSPIPFEPALLHIAKFYPALTVSVVSAFGCFIAGLIDYAVLGWLLNHRYVRPRYENRRFYRMSEEAFHRAPFAALLFFAFTPLPFLPLKFLSIASGYSLWKYQLALLIARFPRYYLLALIGYFVPIPDWALIALALAGGALALWKFRYRPRRGARDGEVS